MAIGEKSLAKKFQDMEAAAADHTEQNEKILILIGATELEGTLAEAVGAKLEELGAEITTLTEAAESFEATKTEAVNEAIEQLSAAHAESIETLNAEHAEGVSGLTERAETAETLAAEQARKLADPAYEMASIPGQEAVDTQSEEQDESLYAQYCALKETDPGAANAFWQQHSKEILATARG